MKVDTIVEMENGENFYIADETVQNGVKYYLANKGDENDEPTTDTKIFKETLDGNDIYLDVVKDESELNYLGAIFLANFSNDLEEEAQAAFFEIKKEIREFLTIINNRGCKTLLDIFLGIYILNLVW